VAWLAHADTADRIDMALEVEQAVSFAMSLPRARWVVGSPCLLNRPKELRIVPPHLHYHRHRRRVTDDQRLPAAVQSTQRFSQAGGAAHPRQRRPDVRRIVQQQGNLEPICDSTSGSMPLGRGS